MRPFTFWRRWKCASIRPRRARLDVEALEDRRQPATLVAPDLLSQYDTGVSAFDNYTRNAQPFFAGTSSSSTGAQIALLIDNVAVAAFAVKRVGGSTFTLQPATPLAEGSHVARFYDSQTKAQSIALTFTIDLTAPDAPPAPTLAVGDDLANLAFQIQGAAGDRLRLSIDGQDMLTVAATGGPQTVNVDASGLGLDPFAPFVVTVAAQDAAGNTSAASDTLSVTLQIAPPAPPADLRLDPTSDTGIHDHDRITAETTLSFSGTALPGETITLLIDGSPWTSQQVGPDGTFALSASPLDAGSHQAAVKAARGAGPAGPASSPLSFTIDLTAPDVPAAPTLAAGDDLTNLTFQIQGAAGDRLRLNIAGQGVLTVIATGIPQTVNVDASDLGLDPFAPFTVTVAAQDAAGNKSDTSDALSVTLQTATPPAPPTDLRLDAAGDTGIYDDDGITAETNLTFSGTALPGETITLLIDGSPWTSQQVGAEGTFALSAGPLDAGPHEAVVQAAHGAGAAGPASTPVYFTIDLAPPVISDIAITPADLSPNDDGVNDRATFQFALSETSYVAVYFLDAENINLGYIPIGLLDAGMQEFDLDVPEFSEGTYTIVVVASDVADNIGDFAEAAFTIDLTPPAAPTIDLVAGDDTGSSAADQLTNLTTLRLTGIGEAGGTMEVREDETILGAMPVGDDGSWVMELTLEEGEHELTVVTKDIAGNSAVSAAKVVTVDSTAPLVDTGDDQAGMQGMPATLTANVSDLHPGTEGSWILVSSSNGQPVPTAEGPTLTFIPSDAGVYVFRHVATDAAGNLGEDTVILTVEDAAPTLQVDWPSAVVLGSPLIMRLGFTDSGNDPLDAWSISWGDGAHDDFAGSATTASHVYDLPGDYTLLVEARLGDTILAAVGPTVSVQPSQTPVLTNTSANAPDTAEDATNHDGATLAALAESLGILHSAGGLGLAITGADAAHGVWQYTLGDSEWSPLGEVSDALARLLVADGQTRVRFVPAKDWSGSASLTVRAWDPSGHINGTQANIVGATSASSETATVAFAVKPVNDAPVLELPATTTAFRNTDQVIGAGFSVADVESARLRISLVIDEGAIVIPDAQGLNFATGSGTPNLTLDGPIDVLNARLAALIYRPAPGYLGPVSIAVTVNDLGFSGSGGAQLATGRLEFEVVNRPPQSIAQPAYSMNANTTLNVAAPGLAAAFVDPDGDAFTVALASPPPVGILVVNADGSFRYTPPPNFVGSVSFAVQASDDVDDSEPLWVTILVKSVYGFRR
jgi:hypothetical protein